MHHGLMYQGNFEQNHSALRPGATTFRGTDGTEHPLPAWPSKIDGVKIGYMEKAGKKFFAVRLQYEDRDIVLQNPVQIDPMRHLGNRRFSAEPTDITDDMASVLLDDILAKNPDQQQDIALLINRVNQMRRAARGD